MISEQNAMSNEPEATEEIRPPGKIRKVALTTLRYIIPSLATISGVVALIYTSFFASNTPDWVAYTPAQELGRPITQQQKVPSLPLDTINSGTVKDAGTASCTEISPKSPNAVKCESGAGAALDPCYFISGEVAPDHVYCFDPKPFQFFAYSVTDWTVPEAVSGEPATATWIYVRAPERNNINDYSPKLVDLEYAKYDICTLEDRFVEDSSEQVYTCLTGSTVTGGIMGDRPHNFVRYSDKETGEITSEWVGWIVYG